MNQGAMTAKSPVQKDAARPGAPKWLRVLLPAVLILVWLTAAGIGGPYFGKVNEVASNDQTTFLPESADATQVQELQGEFTDSEGIPAMVLFVAEKPLTEDQLTQISDLVETTDRKSTR